MLLSGLLTLFIQVAPTYGPVRTPGWYEMSERSSDDTSVDKRVRGTDSGRRSGYHDFELEIGIGHGRQYPVAVINSPAGQARETMVFPYDEVNLDSRLKDLKVALLRSGGSRRQILTPEEAAVQGFGKDIFDALLSGEARSLYDMSVQQAREDGKGLRLKLRILPPELARLPWEYLYDDRHAEYVSLSRETPVVRFLESRRPTEPLSVTPPLQILGMIASPSDLPPLDTGRERKRVEQALTRLESNGLVDLTWIETPTWRELQRAMRAGPWHVFHFIGHGGFDRVAGEGVVALADDDGRSHNLSATELGRLLADHNALRLAVLNSCEGATSSDEDVFSSTAAVLVRRGIPAVLAMQYEITDRAAIEFARTFYESLADGYPVDGAVAEARKAVSLAVTNTIEWGTPVLFMRTADGVVFDLPAGPDLTSQMMPDRQRRRRRGRAARRALHRGSERVLGQRLGTRLAAVQGHHRHPTRLQRRCDPSGRGAEAAAMVGAPERGRRCASVGGLAGRHRRTPGAPSRWCPVR